MSDILTAHKTGRGWIMDLPPEMAQAMGVAEGSLAVLYPQPNGFSYEILPPDLEATHNEEKPALLREIAESMKANSFTGNPPRFTREELHERR